MAQTKGSPQYNAVILYPETLQRGDAIFQPGAQVGNGTDLTTALDWGPALAAAEARAIASGSLSIIIPPGTFVVNTNETVTSNLRFEPGAQFSINSGKTLTFSGIVFAPATRIFAGAGTATLSGAGQVTLSAWTGGSGGSTQAAPSAPATVTGATGTAASKILDITGAVGGISSNASGTGGVGAAGAIVGGVGGDATGTTAPTGGAGGALAFTGGAGDGPTATASGQSTGGAGGASGLVGGAGGAPTGGNTNVGGPGGASTLTGGNGGNAATTGGAGGAVILTGGNAGTGGNANGGDVQLTPGSKTGSGTAGLIKATESGFTAIPIPILTYIQSQVYTAPAAGSVALWTAPNTGETWKVAAVSVRFTGAGGASYAVTLNVEGAAVAPGSGTAQLTGTMSLTGTANTTVNGVLIASPTAIAAGSSLSLTFSGTATGNTGTVVTVALQKVS